MNSRDALQKLLSEVDVTIDGPNPVDIQIHDERACKALLSGHSLAMGEAFMDGWWSCEDLAELVYRMLRTNPSHFKTISWWFLLRALIFNLQSRARAYIVGQQHYDIGNDLYQAMLDPLMVYTSAIWKGVDNLAAAQEQKLERICQQLKLKAGDRVLDIGCGWGSFMKYAAEKYGVSCVGLSVSKEQTKLGQKLCEGLPVEFVITDYRDFTTKQPFDHVVSVEMIEAVGPKNFRVYFEKVHELLKSGGKFMLQTITDPRDKPLPNPWIDKYIFPNGVLPSLKQLDRATKDLFSITDSFEIGKDYDHTLLAWWNNFKGDYPRLAVANPRYDERFYRMWKFYIHICAGSFRAESIGDKQILYARI